MAAAPVILLLLAQTFCTEGTFGDRYRMIAALTALLAVTFAHILGETPLVSVIGLLLGMAIALAGTLVADKTMLCLGVIAAIIGIVGFCMQTMRLSHDYTWALLAAAGVVVLFSASLFEKRHSLPFAKLHSLWGRLNAQ